MKTFENFISYRRDSSSLVVKNIFDSLNRLGYDTFCDVYSLNSGKFEGKLLDTIDRCTNFILVLNNESLIKCSKPKDWLTLEIERAIKQKKNIILVFLEEPFFPSDLPKEIETIKSYNGIDFNVQYLEKFTEKLISYFLVEEKVNNNNFSNFVVDGVNLIKYVGSSRYVEIPDGIEIIKGFAFKDKTFIEEIKFPKSLIEVEQSAFERCMNLSFIELPDNTRYIRKKAFSRCFNLAYINLNDNLEFLGERAFSFCNKMKHIQITTSISSIHATTFNNCSLLRAINVDEQNNAYTSVDGILYTKDLSKILRCPEGIQDNIVTIESATSVINPHAFSKCLNIEDVILPRDLKKISEYAFKDCYNIQRLLLSETVTFFDLSAVDGWITSQVISSSKNFDQSLLYRINQQIILNNSYTAENNISDYILVLTTFESINEAKKMAKMLLERKLISSGQIKKIHSIYSWQNQIQQEDEYELSCFSESILFNQIRDFITDNHSYELCEIICVPITKTTEEFGDWISQNTISIVSKN